MKSLQGVDTVPVVISSFLRPHFVKGLIPFYDKRTFYPHRIIVAHGSPENDEDQERDRECIHALKRFKVEGIIDEVLFAKNGWDRPNPGQGGLQDMALKWIRENMPAARYVAFSQSDLEPPDTRPCWLSKMVRLMDTYGDDYAAIAARIEVTPRLEIDETADLIDSRKSIPSVGRIMKMEDLNAMGERPFGGRVHWESIMASSQIEKLQRKQAFATRVFFSHRGYAPNKGYGEDVTQYHTNAPNKASLYADKPYPKTDPKSMEPLPFQDYRFHKEETEWRDKYWKEHIGLQDENISATTRRRVSYEAISKEMEARGGRWADMGCGKYKFHKDAVGIDAWPYDGVNFVGDVFDPWFIEDGYFDGIGASHILEHCKRPIKEALGEWLRILKPRGVMVIVVPDADNRPSTIVEPSHDRAFTKEVLAQLMGRSMHMKVWRCENLAGCPKNKKDLICVAQKRGEHWDHV